MVAFDLALLSFNLGAIVLGNFSFDCFQLFILKHVEKSLQVFGKYLYNRQTVAGAIIILQVRMDSKLIDALGLFVKTRVSALPVVSADNKVLDIYAKFDVLVSTCI